jgi:hypothetical protein
MEKLREIRIEEKEVGGVPSSAGWLPRHKVSCEME